MIPGKTYKHILDLLLLFLVALIFHSCGEGSKSSKLEEPHLSDLERIRQSGILKVAVDYNSTSYFVYRGKPMGYQYDLIQALCKDLEVRPEFTISTNIDETFEGLLTGTYDLAAKNLTVTRLNRQDVAFTKPLKQTRQVIVQRKPVKSSPDSLYLKTIPQLANKTVHVQQRKTYAPVITAFRRNRAAHSCCSGFGKWSGATYCHGIKWRH
jgi:membrane-bound lytic murein transglycosylase F